MPSARGDLLMKLGRADEARAEFERAGALTRNARERELLQVRARACASNTWQSAECRAPSGECRTDVASNEAEGKGVEPSTGFPASDFESDR